MNSKAIRKQLLAAVAMVLVAAVALGSSTYAWFAAAGQVTATGMQVKAQSEGNLVIRYKTGNWGTTAEASTKLASLMPSSTYDLDNWVHATADDARYFFTTGTYDDVTTQVGPKVDDGDRESGYALVKEFEIRCATQNTADAAKGLYVSDITVTRGTTQANMSGALRVGVQTIYTPSSGDPITSDPLIFAPVGTGDNAPKYGFEVLETDTTAGDVNTGTGDQGVHDKDGTFHKVTLATKGVDGSGAPQNTLLDGGKVLPISGGQPVKVYIYVWFEGEDMNLYSDNFAVEDLDVSVVFKSISTT